MHVCLFCRLHALLFYMALARCDFLVFMRERLLQEYSVQLTFREQWLDERLKFNDFGGRLKYLTLTEANRVWMPDLFFANEKEGHTHNIIMPNVYIRIFPYGSVLYSIRYLIFPQNKNADSDQLFLLEYM